MPTDPIVTPPPPPRTHYFLVFATRADADTILNEIASTPDIEGGIGPVWLWFDPDEATNAVVYAASADGRVALAHPWNDVDAAWLTTYCDGWITAGKMSVLEAMPSDWAYPQVP